MIINRIRRTLSLTAALIIVGSMSCQVFADDSSLNFDSSSFASDLNSDSNVSENSESDSTLNLSDSSLSEFDIQKPDLKTDFTSQATLGTINFDNSTYSSNVDDFLKQSGFDYQSFAEQKFDLPDLSKVETSADIKLQYANLLKNMQDNGLGKTYSFSNKGYSSNVISSFKNMFGDSLSKGYKTYKLDTSSAKKLFNEANTTRDKLFASVKKGSTYKAVSNNLNISSAFNMVDKYLMSPSQASSTASLSSLQSIIKSNLNSSTANYQKGPSTSEYNRFAEGMGFAESDYNSAYNTYKDAVTEKVPVNSGSSSAPQYTYKTMTMEEKYQKALDEFEDKKSKEPSSKDLRDARTEKVHEENSQKASEYYQNNY